MIIRVSILIMSDCDYHLRDPFEIVHDWRETVQTDGIVMMIELCTLIARGHNLYIYKVEILSIRLSVTPITRLRLLRLTYQLPITIELASSYFKFVAAR